MLDYSDYEDGGGNSDEGEMDGAFKCERCPKEFADRADLRCHIKAVHEERNMYSCGICSQIFSRKQRRAYCEKTCASGTSKKNRRTLPIIKFYPRCTCSDEIVTIWTITYSDDVSRCDPVSLLKESGKALKDIIRRQLHEKLRIDMTIHVVFEKVYNVDTKTVALTTESDVLCVGASIDQYLADTIEELYEKMQYEACDNGWTIDYLQRLEMQLYSI